MDATVAASLVGGQISYESEVNGLKKFSLNMKLQMEDENKTKVYSVGTPSKHPTICVLLLGETGSGKSTFVNGVLNYLYNIEFENNSRLIVKDQKKEGARKETESQTDYVTVYKIHHQEGMRENCDLIIIDTPGLNDTKGEQQQENIMKNLEAFLTSDYGIDTLHCLGLVANATINRHSNHQKDILGKVMNLLGNYVPKITNIIATHATDKTMVDEVMRNAGVKFKEKFEFDNYVVFSSLEPERINLLGERWRVMVNQYNSFFSALLKAKPVSVKVLREKKLLEISQRTLKMQVEKLAGILTTLEESRKELTDHKLQEERTKGWQQTKQTLENRRQTLQKRLHAHNCIKCDQTCTVCLTDDPIPHIGAFLAPALPLALLPGIAGIIGPLLAGITGIGVLIHKVTSKKGCHYANGHADMCTARNCYHSLSQHKKQNEMIIQSMKSEDVVDENMKMIFDEALSNKEAVMQLIESNKTELQVEKGKMVESVYKMFKLVQILLPTPITTIQELFHQLQAEVRLGHPRNIHHAVEVLNILKDAAKQLETCGAEEFLRENFP